MSLLFSTGTTLPATGSAALLLTAWVAAAYDWTSWRIPNPLLAGSAAAAVMLALFAPDTAGLWPCLLGGAAGLALLLPVYMAGGTGAGDVKLLAVIGMHAGWMNLIEIALLSALIGGGWSVFLLFANSPAGGWMQSLHITRDAPAPQMGAGSRGTIPYGVVMAIGVTLVIAAMQFKSS
jgi:prepilin peptidase CpaA